MKKLLLSALAISAMFVSCGDKDKGEMPAPPKKVDTSAKGAFVEIYDIQENMYKKPVADLKKEFEKIKEKLAVDAFGAPNKAAVQGDFVTWIEGVKPEGDAQKGKAGKIGNKPRYVDERGIEYGQLIKKGMIGAYQLSTALKANTQARGVKSKEDQEKLLKEFAVALIGSYDYIDNKKVDITSHGKTKPGYPVMDGNEFGKYLNVVSNSDVADFKKISDDFYGALKKAKASLGTKDFSGNLFEALSLAQKVVAIRCVHYFEKVDDPEYKKGVVTDGSLHSISEGLGFYYALQFTYNISKHSAYVTYPEAEIVHTIDLWNASETTLKLKELSKSLAESFDFKVEDAKK